jgi:pimeloyl-ACP methyl ester carboxylesterase
VANRRVIGVALLFWAWGALVAAQEFQVRSADGAEISFECAGSGPELLIVHGGTGDRTRWTPMFAHLGKDFTVCAMDRRAHGRSGDKPDYTLRKEAEDVAAVVNARGSPVVVLGHSFGGTIAFEAAFLTPRIRALVLYEPALRVDPHVDALAKMDSLILAGDRQAATTTFMREVVGVSPAELAAMQGRPSWKSLVASIDSSIRQHRALAANPWRPDRAADLRIPTLLLLGQRTENPDLKLSVESLAGALPNSTVVVLPGEHNAMDTDREQLARVVRDFLSARVRP